MKTKNNKDEKRYIIECSERQLELLSMMCDRMARLIQGQLDFSVQEFAEEAWERYHKTPEYPHGIGSKEWYNMRESLECYLNAIKRLCWNLDSRSDYGINYDDTADILWDMHQVIRHQLWLDEPEEKRSNITVDAYDATCFGDEPLIKVYRKGDKK